MSRSRSNIPGPGGLEGDWQPQETLGVGAATTEEKHHSLFHGGEKPPGQVRPLLGR